MVLIIGTRGAAVVELQQALAKFGFVTGGFDGVFGLQTQAAVVAFQATRGMRADGIAGLNTLKALGLVPQPNKLEGLVEGTLDWYRAAFDVCEIAVGFEAAVARDAKLVLSHKAVYEAVCRNRKMPWFVLGVIHFREASCNMQGLLHNGQLGVIGPEAMKRNRRSTIVPVGVGPFPNWETAAQDALNRQPIGKVVDWEIGKMLFHLERYNGKGYLPGGRGEANVSPYLWGRTTLSDGTGLFVEDGRYDPHAPTTKTSGAAAVLKWLERNGFIEIDKVGAMTMTPS